MKHITQKSQKWVLLATLLIASCANNQELRSGLTSINSTDICYQKGTTITKPRIGSEWCYDFIFVGLGVSE